MNPAISWNQSHEIKLDIYHILHSETNQIIKFEPIWNSLEHFLESLQRIHVKDAAKGNEKWEGIGDDKTSGIDLLVEKDMNGGRQTLKGIRVNTCPDNNKYSYINIINYQHWLRAIISNTTHNFMNTMANNVCPHVKNTGIVTRWHNLMELKSIQDKNS